MISGLGYDLKCVGPISDLGVLLLLSKVPFEHIPGVAYERSPHERVGAGPGFLLASLWNHQEVSTLHMEQPSLTWASGHEPGKCRQKLVKIPVGTHDPDTEF